MKQAKWLIPSLCIVILVCMFAACSGFGSQDDAETSSSQQTESSVEETSSVVSQEPYTSVDEKIYCTATIDDNFGDKTVTAILNKEHMYNEYTLADFEGLNVKRVEMVYTREQLDRYLQKVPEYRQRVRLYLKEPGKQQVLDLVKELEKRNDFMLVDVNWYRYTAQPYPPDSY